MTPVTLLLLVGDGSVIGLIIIVLTTLGHLTQFQDMKTG